MPATAGRSSERARMATCEVAPPATVAEAQHLLGVELGGVRRGEVLGDQNGARRDPRLLHRRSGEDPQDAPAHVPQVDGTPGHDRVPELGQALRMGGVGPLPREGRALALGDGALGDVEQVGVLQELLVGGEDGRLLGIRLGLQLRLKLLQLVLAPVHGVLELAALLARIRIADLRDPDLLPAQLVDLAHAEARRCGDAEEQVGVIARGARRRGIGRVRLCGGRGLGGPAARVAEPRRQLRQDGRDGLLRVRPFGDHHHLVAEADLDPHDGDHALGVGLVLAPLEQDLGLETLGQVGQDGRRAGVEPRVIGYQDRLRGDQPAASLGLEGPLGRQVQGQQGVGARPDPARGGVIGGDPLPVRHHDLGQETLGMGGQEVGVERDQGVPRRDLLSLWTLGLKPSPFRFTVSSPMCIISSTPSGVVRVTA